MGAAAPCTRSCIPLTTQLVPVVEPAAATVDTAPCRGSLIKSLRKRIVNGTTSRWSLLSWDIIGLDGSLRYGTYRSAIVGA